MHIFSKACEYSIKAVIFLATRTESDQRMRLREVSKAIGSPEAFTAKILQQLVRQRVLKSVKGPGGGFCLQEDARNIALYRIVLAIDGDSFFTDCAMGLKKCSETQPCPIHKKFRPIRDEIKEMLINTTILETAKSVQKGECVLKFFKHRE